MCALPNNGKCEVENWLEKVVQWSSLTEEETVISVHPHLSNLTSFLISLNQSLKSLNNLQKSVEIYPSVGQLLGRLWTLPAVIRHYPCYEALMECMMNFYIENPKTSLEVQAKQWVLSQIRNSVCKGQNTACQLSHTNSTQDDFNKIYLQMIQENITSCVSKSHRRWNSDMNSYVPGTLEPFSLEPLYKLSSICLCLCEETYYVSLLADIVRELSWSCVGDERTETVYKEVMNSSIWEVISSKTGCESESAVYKLQLSLWTAYLPSLERHLLHLVDKCVVKHTFSSHQETYHTIKASRIPQACAENVQIHSAVKCILKTLLQQTQGQGQLVHFITIFHCCILNHISSIKNCPSLVCRYPRNLKSLVCLLQVDPNSLPIDHAGQHLMSIADCLHALLTDPLPTNSQKDLMLCLSENMHWYYTALLISLKAKSQVIPSFIFLTKCYHWLYHPEDAVKEYEICLQNMIMSLRSLLHKSSLSSCDIQCVLSMNSALLEDKTHFVIGQLLLLFSVISDSGIYIIGPLLQMATQTESPKEQLPSLVHTIDLLIHMKRHGSVKHPASVVKTLQSLKDASLSRSDSNMDIDEAVCNDLTRVTSLNKYVETCIELLNSCS